MKKYGVWILFLALTITVGCASKEKKGTERPYIEGEPRTMLDVKISPVYFDFDKADIRSDARATLMDHVTYLKNNGDVNVQIEGHCDERGTVEYNIALGERRALTVKDFLTSRGVSSSRFTFISYGEERPADPGHSEDAWAKNRRAEFVLYK